MGCCQTQQLNQLNKNNEISENFFCQQSLIEGQNNQNISEKINNINLDNQTLIKKISSLQKIESLKGTIKQKSEITENKNQYQNTVNIDQISIEKELKIKQSKEFTNEFLQAKSLNKQFSINYSIQQSSICDYSYEEQKEDKNITDKNIDIYQEQLNQYQIQKNQQSQTNQQFKVGPELFVGTKQTKINEDYDIQDLLGEGAYGKVWKVVQKKTNIIRAMKTLKKSQILKEDEQRMFSEINILKNLDHPNILRIFELYQDQYNYFLITEYCSGGELFDRIKELNHLTEKKAAELIKQILSALSYCHQNQIVHRDLKPENILFENQNENCNIKVIDFGTSRQFNSTSKMTKKLGTSYYIAPEVLRQEYNEKCDVWSIGVIMYILLCGYPPFTGRNESQILRRVAKGKFEFDKNDWKGISREAKTLISKMLEFDPNKRMSVSEAYQDVWITKNVGTGNLNKKILMNLSKFYKQNNLKTAISTFIASQIMKNAEKELLYTQFKELDKDGDGILTKDELIQGYLKICGDLKIAEDITQKIMEQCDSNQSGKIDFTEFIVASTNQSRLLSRNKILKTFKIFDINGDGFIDREELNQMMGGLDDQTWEQILQDCDENNDGQISQMEFIKMLEQKYSDNVLK